MSDDRNESRHCAEQLNLLFNSVPLFIAAILLSASNAYALTFEPTEMEWNTWTPECRARYVISQAGRNTEFAARTSAASVQQWASHYGVGWGSMHHYCAGKILFRRAKASRDHAKAEFLFGQAISESEYTRQRTPITETLYTDILILEARAYDELGENEKALELVYDGIRLHPKYGAPYAFGSILLKQAGKALEARNLLLAALDTDASGAAELHYFLGMIFLDLDDLVSARLHADQAARLGYPLPGLQRAVARREVGENTQ